MRFNNGGLFVIFATVLFTFSIMSNVLSFFRVLLKFNSVNIDNVFFRLHYKHTVTVFLASSLLVISKQLLGEPMDCQFPDLPGASFNAYCYIHSTFPVEETIIHPVGKKMPRSEVFRLRSGDTSNVLDYYQWVFIALVIQGICFYVPHYIWKAWEGGRMKMLAEDLVSPVLRHDCIERNVEPLVEYIYTQLHSHNSYAYKYFSCEALNCINVVSQICFMRAFIGEGFEYYGIHALLFNPQPDDGNTMNPMEQIFPTISKCTYRRYTSTGDIMDLYGICVLTQNSINQKIYIFLWFWCHMLAAITVLAVIFRIITLVSSRVRFWGFTFNGDISNSKDVKVVYEKLWIGDWLLLMILRSNLNPLAYKELLLRLARRFNDEDDASPTTQTSSELPPYSTIV
ncbi:viral innexin 2 [Diadegma fenestrale ichnovirus]|nr:viral innexin 2 [Diadegma fenestrale ichnovirus]